MSGKIGFLESLSIAVGGMVGGGIFAVLGVVASAASTAAWIAFALSGVVALCAGYSFLRLHRVADGDSGPISHVESLTGSRSLAGMAAWVFTFGYVGTMAMYAHAFGGYARELLGVHAVVGVSTRPLLSVAAVALFVGLNVVGARATGRAEDTLVGAKVLLLIGFVGGGLYYGLTAPGVVLQSGLDVLGIGPLTAAAIAFVAFEGWELLLFDREAIADAGTTIPRVVYIAITATTLLYVLVAFVTTNLVPLDTIQQNPEVALAIAARPVFGSLGFTLIAVAAVISTASALNATLFSAARLSRSMAAGGTGDSPSEAAETGPTHHRCSEYEVTAGDVVPDGGVESGEPPLRSLLVLGTLAAVLTAYGDLNAVTSFASGAFITLFGGASALALRHRDGGVTTVVPAVGATGAAIALVGMTWHLHRTDPGVLVAVAVIWAVVLSVYWVPRR